jgi:hypothetical protein
VGKYLLQLCQGEGASIVIGSMRIVIIDKGSKLSRERRVI